MQNKNTVQPPPRVYIAGKVTGEKLVDLTAKFGLAQKKLEALGYEVVNPLEVVAKATESEPDGHWLKTPWPMAMRYCIAALCTCHIICPLSCTPQSKGATLELEIAKSLGMEFISI